MELVLQIAVGVALGILLADYLKSTFTEENIQNFGNKFFLLIIALPVSYFLIWDTWHELILSSAAKCMQPGQGEGWYQFYIIFSVIIFLGFMLGRWIYTTYLKPRYGWDGWIFTGLMIVIQMIHDLLFYVGIIRPIDKGANAMLDVFKDYAEQGGWKILIADAGMVVGSTAVAMMYKNVSMPVVAGITALAAYAVPYLLYAKPIDPKIIIGGGPVSVPM